MDRAIIGDLSGTPTIVVDGTAIVKGVDSAELIQVTAGSFTVLDNSEFTGLDVAGGTLSLGRSNVNAAGTTLRAGGTLELANDSALGTGGLTINGGTVTAVGSAITSERRIARR